MTNRPVETADRLLKNGFRLEYTTLAWNVIGVGITAWAAIVARSVGLAGFGFDSLIEIGASTVVVWELSGTVSHLEKPALRFIGAAFFVLAAYIVLQIAATFLWQIRPAVSPLGIAWLAATFVVMLGLAFGKAHIGAKLGNTVLQTEGRVTLVDAYLAEAKEIA